MDVRARALLAIALVLILMASSMGCLSIFATKDALIFRKDAPRVEYHKVKPITIQWSANKLLGDDVEETPRNILVKPGTKYLQLTISVDMPSTLIPKGQGIPPAHFDFRLRAPTGDVYWEANYSEDADDTVPVQGPSAGLWIISIEGMGYGVDASGITAQDKFSVEVELYEPR